ncbi:MAG: lactate utilization protein [Candidatus Kaiserbacteria bacterium]|nr:MAG: lactate utilization protein [Candidatus Kaiserbacteria bacterium]
MEYTKLATEEIIEKAVHELEARRFKTARVQNRAEALEYIKKTIPAGASVMNGSSVTLEEIGFVDYLKAGGHPWRNLHEEILNEPDKDKRAQARMHAVVSDYYLGSVHALTEGGEMVIGSNTGSQQPHLSYTSQNLILVVGTQKIVPDLPAALERLEKHVIPLEDEHMKGLYGSGTQHNKTLILYGESSMMKRNATVLLVEEKLGF